MQVTQFMKKTSCSQLNIDMHFSYSKLRDFLIMHRKFFN